MSMPVHSLVSLSGLRIWHCHSSGIGHRCSSHLVLLCLWHRLAAAADIWPLAWELPRAVGAALKTSKQNKMLNGKKKKAKCFFHVGLLLDSSRIHLTDVYWAMYYVLHGIFSTGDTHSDRTQSLPSKGLRALWDVSIHQVGQKQTQCNMMSSEQSAVGG